MKKYKNMGSQNILVFSKLNKIFLILIVFLVSQNLFSQEYFFDKFYEYDELDRATIVMMINSKDSSYSFLCKSYDKKLSGRIIDTKNNMYHNYVMENKNSELVFTYLNSEIIKKVDVPCYDKTDTYEIIKEPVDAKTTLFRINRYGKNKKIIRSSTIKATEYNLPFFKFAINKLFYHFVYCQKLDLPNNFLPITVEIDYHNGNKTKTELKQEKDINTTLTLKKENIIIKE